MLSSVLTAQAPLASLRNCLAAQPGGYLVAVVQEAVSVGLLDSRKPDAEAFQLPTSLGPSHKASACAWSGDGRCLLTAWHGGMGMLTVHAVSVALHVQQVFLEELFFWPKDMAVVSKESGMLVALAGAPGVVLYSLERAGPGTGQPAWQLSQRARLSHMWPACALCVSADGSALAAAALGGQLSVWDLRPGLDTIQLDLQVQVPAERVTSMAFSPDGTALAVVTWVGSTYLYSRQCGTDSRSEVPESPKLSDASAARAAEARIREEQRLAGTDSISAQKPGAVSALAVSSSPAAVPGPAEEVVSRLAWIDHGARGVGGWSFVGDVTAEGPIKPHVPCISLLAWLDGSHFIISMQGSHLVICAKAGDGLKALGKEVEGKLVPGGFPDEGHDLSAGLDSIRGLTLLQEVGSDEQTGGARLFICDGQRKVSCYPLKPDVELQSLSSV